MPMATAVPTETDVPLGGSWVTTLPLSVASQLLVLDVVTASPWPCRVLVAWSLALADHVRHDNVVGEVVGGGGGGGAALGGNRDVHRAGAGRAGCGDLRAGVGGDVAAAPPKLTPVAPERLVPVIVTLVPPAVLPLAGEIPVTIGGAGGGGGGEPCR